MAHQRRMVQPSFSGRVTVVRISSGGWRPYGEGYRFVARHSGKCLDVAGWSTDDGTGIIQWQCHGGANQTWLLRPVTTTAIPAPQALLGSQR